MEPRRFDCFVTTCPAMANESELTQGAAAAAALAGGTAVAVICNRDRVALQIKLHQVPQVRPGSVC